MDFDKALKIAKGGFAVRHPAMGPGWSMIWSDGRHWFVNPITGTNVAFALTPDDRMRADWAKLQKDGGP